MELTLREKEVLKLLAKGHIHTDIAKTIGISFRTLQGHETNLMAKFQLATTDDLYQLARNLFP